MDAHCLRLGCVQLRFFFMRSKKKRGAARRAYLLDSIHDPLFLRLYVAGGELLRLLRREPRRIWLGQLGHGVRERSS